MSVLPPFRAASPRGIWLSKPTTFDFMTPGALPPGATLTRASSGWYFEGANYIRNASMIGVATGSPGTVPTNWPGIGSGGGLTRTVVGSGTEDGIPYVDIRMAGTPNATSSTGWAFDTALQISALQGQVWTAAVYARVVGGSTANLTGSGVQIREYNSGATVVQSSSTTVSVTAAALRTQLYTHARTLTDPTTVAVQSGFYFGFTNGQPVDITFRIGFPQLTTSSLTFTPTLYQANTDAPRLAYDPSSGAMLGLLNEPAVTNSLRNGTAAGAAAGSPGTQPTNWSLTGNGGAFNGLTRTINGIVTEDGLTGLSVTYVGTPSASGSITFNLDSNTNVAAAQGQTWLGAGHFKVLSGAMIQALSISVVERDSGGSSLGTSNIQRTPTSAAARTQRFDIPPRTLANATAAFVSMNMTYAYTNGVAENFTLFLADLQLAQLGVPSSLIPTTSSAVARAGDTLALTLANGTYQVNITRASGVSMAKATVSGGSYTVPQDPSPLQRVTAWRLK